MDTYVAISDVVIAPDDEQAIFAITPGSQSIKIHSFSVTHERLYENIVPTIDWSWWWTNDLGTYDEVEAAVSPLDSSAPTWDNLNAYVLQYTEGGGGPTKTEPIYDGRLATAIETVGTSPSLGDVVQFAKGQEIVAQDYTHWPTLYVYNNSYRLPLRVISTVTFSL